MGFQLRVGGGGLGGLEFQLSLRFSTNQDFHVIGAASVRNAAAGHPEPTGLSGRDGGSSDWCLVGNGGMGFWDKFRVTLRD